MNCSFVGIVGKSPGGTERIWDVCKKPAPYLYVGSSLCLVHLKEINERGLAGKFSWKM